MLLADDQGRLYTPDLRPISVILHSTYDVVRLRKLILAHLDRKCFQLELFTFDKLQYTLVGCLDLLGGTDPARLFCAGKPDQKVGFS